ncbi:MAG: hypothetical protein IAG13_36130 [Deltaproteobacteria bacterium]|nr:hypothetical protein [Nannocystaceae bacterium]
MASSLSSTIPEELDSELAAWEPDSELVVAVLDSAAPTLDELSFDEEPSVADVELELDASLPVESLASSPLLVAGDAEVEPGPKPLSSVVVS